MGKLPRFRHWQNICQKIILSSHSIFRKCRMKNSRTGKFFLLYLKPIINGTGNYYLEAQTRDERCTDVIVDYRGEQFIVEQFNERGEQQLTEYLDYYHKDKGYMLSFNFNKNKTVGVKEIKAGNKTIVETVV